MSSLRSGSPAAGDVEIAIGRTLFVRFVSVTFGVLACLYLFAMTRIGKPDELMTGALGMRWTILILLAVIDTHAWSTPGTPGASQGQASHGTPQAESMTSGARELKGSAIVTTSSDELRYDKVLLLPEGTLVDRQGTGAPAAEITRVQVGQKDEKPVFVEIDLKKGTTLAPDAATALAAAIQAQDTRIQKCDGSLLCVRVCKAEGKERCCEWACHKTGR